MPKGVYKRTPEILAKWRKSIAWYVATPETRERISKAKKGSKRPDLTARYIKERELFGEQRKIYHKKYMKDYHQEYMKDKREAVYTKRKENYKKDRLTCLVHYGGNPPKCACCGEFQVKFLALDHINGGGRKHKQEMKVSSLRPGWFIKNNFPSGFQILCHNCNMAKGFYGICPHKESQVMNEIISKVIKGENWELNSEFKGEYGKSLINKI